MKKLSQFPDDEKFYRGTIIVLKDMHDSPVGKFDVKYCMIYESCSNTKFEMLDLYRSMGGCIIHNMKPNVKDHVAVNKDGIKQWVKEYFELFYNEPDSLISKIDDIVYIEYLTDYFTQANRDIRV